MNRVRCVLTIGVTCAVLILVISCKEDRLENTPIAPPSAIGTKEDPFKRFDFEVQQQIDPVTGRIPVNIHKKEAQFVKGIPTVESYLKEPNFRTKIQTWTLAGPSNVGGRTRAIALDVTDENVIVAGGVSGGMWKSEDSGLSWARTSHPAVINSATCVVQDTRPGKENIWYHGTGELLGNSPRAVGAPYRGDGIFKSTDGALTWDILPSTSDGLESQFNSPFNYVWNMALNATQLDVDEVYAAVYGGIVRSVDGGDSWQNVLGTDLLNFSGNNLNQTGSFYSNIIVTPSGTFYATLSEYISLGNYDFDNKGVFRSIDGVAWENITPNGFTEFHERTVMAFAPSNENIVYFSVENGGSEIWKYNDATNIWTNLSSNIPDFEGDLGPYDSQGGYNMMVAVHPDDEDIVFLGGTNLYRSTDGFSSSLNTDWIGGYDTGGSSSEYPGHHPDQHAVAFYPSNPNRMLSANDGGIMSTNNNLTNTPFWTSLNNGYVTSQFYSVSLSQMIGSNSIVGGMQDNGSYLKTTPGENQPWSSLLGGDGGFSATTDNDLFWYASFQESNIFRLTLNDESGLTSFARVDPLGGSGYLFINPFVLDPNNFNRMYLAGGVTVWRNNNLSQIPSGDQEPTPINWDKLDVNETSSNVTALDISTVPVNILYVGTGQGKVLKIDSANIAGGVISQIFSMSGNIVNISIDPSNADNVFIIYSNYNIPSIFFSEDGGLSLTDVGGNLEEFTDGTGNGPSVRWSEIVPLASGQYLYFVGTSSGLYSTSELNGLNTIWLKEGNENIGNSVVRMMDYRPSDGRFAVATHGNGVFETTIEGQLQIEKPGEEVQSLVVANNYPNPFSEHIDIEFTIPEQAPLSVLILNPSGQVIKTILNFPQFAGNVVVRWDGTDGVGRPVGDGMYFYRILYQGTITGGKMIYDRQ